MSLKASKGHAFLTNDGLLTDVFHSCNHYHSFYFVAVFLFLRILCPLFYEKKKHNWGAVEPS